VAEPDISVRLVDNLNQTYGRHAGCRAAHAKGVLCAGTFHPGPAAKSLTSAAHLNGGPLRAHVRFSNGGGNPTVPDGARDGRGIGLKIYGPAGPTDIVGLSLPQFFSRTPEDLLEFNLARRPDPETGVADQAKVMAYLAAHPETVPAVTAAMSLPVPASYAAVTFNSIHAYGFGSGHGEIRYGRYRFVPEATDPPLTDAEAAERPADFLRQELAGRLERGPIQFRLDVILAGPSDPIEDPTVAWPEDRPTVELGRLEITGLAFDRETEGDILVFDPTRVPPEISLSPDPILLARPGAYAVSVTRRSQTGETE
jgi:catalase